MQLDLDQMIDNNGGDKELVAKIVKIFVNKRQSLMDDMLSAAQDKDCEKLWRSAHTLRGIVSFFLVDNINNLVKEIELDGKSGDTKECSVEKVEKLTGLTSELVESFEELLR